MNNSTPHRIVLFVEDDRAIAEVMKDFLEDQFQDAITALTAESVPRAKELFLTFQNRIVLILIDSQLKLAVNGGLIMVRWLRQEMKFMGTLVAFSGDHDAVDDLMVAGCSEALPKPIRPDRFLNLVHRELKDGK